jgi:hypothetical protein
MSKTKSPQDKKAFSLERDRRNTYGENAKSSRKNIPKSKQLGHQAERRAATVPLNRVKGTASEDEAIQAELLSRESQISKRRVSFVKHADAPLGEVLKRKADRKAIKAKFGKNNPQGLTPAPHKTKPTLEESNVGFRS